MPRTRVWPLPLAELKSLKRGERERESLINQVFTEYKSVSLCHWSKTIQINAEVLATSLGSSLCHGGNPQEKPPPGCAEVDSRSPRTSLNTEMAPF